MRSSVYFLCFFFSWGGLGAVWSVAWSLRLFGVALMRLRVDVLCVLIELGWSARGGMLYLALYSYGRVFFIPAGYRQSI